MGKGRGVDSIDRKAPVPWIKLSSSREVSQLFDLMRNIKVGLWDPRGCSVPQTAASTNRILPS